MEMISRGIMDSKTAQKTREQFYIISGLICFGLSLGFFMAMNIMGINDLSIPGGLLFGLGFALFMSYYAVREPEEKVVKKIIKNKLVKKSAVKKKVSNKKTKKTAVKKSVKKKVVKKKSIKRKGKK